MNMKTKSLIMLTISMLIYGTIGIFRRYIPVSSGMLAMFRGFIGAVFLLIFVCAKKRKVFADIPMKKIVLLIVSGAVMGFNWFFLMEAYNYTSVATATLCYYMEPVLLYIGSIIVFKEKLTIKGVICALTALAGMVMVSGVVSQGMPGQGEIKGIIFGLTAALLYSIVVMMNKALGDTDTYGKTIIQLVSAAAVMIPYILLTDTSGVADVTVSGWILVAVVGLVHTGLAYALYFGSMDGLESRTIGIISYIDPVTALVLSMLILGESMDIYGIIGAVMIIGSALIDTLTVEKENKSGDNIIEDRK